MRLRVIHMKYEARMDGVCEPIEAETLADALEQAEEWIRDGNWDTTEGTVWATGYLIEIDEENDFVEADRHRIEVTINPDEPPCVDADKHDWQAPHALVGGIKENPGVWGNGGGVTISEVCMRCGCGKFTDTWAQNPETGEQGLESVKYTPGEYDIPEVEDEA